MILPRLRSEKATSMFSAARAVRFETGARLRGSRSCKGLARHIPQVPAPEGPDGKAPSNDDALQPTAGTMTKTLDCASALKSSPRPGRRGPEEGSSCRDLRLANRPAKKDHWRMANERGVSRGLPITTDVPAGVPSALAVVRPARAGILPGDMQDHLLRVSAFGYRTRTETLRGIP